jgi:hypothetical protein
MKTLCWLMPLFLRGLLSAQSQPANGDANRAAETSETATATSTANGTSKDRLFFTLPNFLTLENAGNAPPLTAAQKFAVTARGSFDPVELAWYGALAGIGQAENSEPSEGQGVEGYAKRYGIRFGDGVIEDFATRAIFPSLLHQDPRYYQMGKGSFWRRVRYSVGRIFITRSDSGTTQFNFSEIVGSAAAAGISTFTYHPKDERNLANATNVWGTQVGLDTLSYLAKEFWPDIRRKLHRSKTGQAH